jgi:predicted nucleic acid-binding protein
VSERVVVDASLAAKWVLNEPYSPQATALLQEWIGAEVQILAPALLATELAHILYKRVVRGLNTLEDARTALHAVLHADITHDHDSMLSLRALELAHQLGLPATYDAHYLALAERESCAYWTADERLWNTVKGHLSWVHWIGDLSQGDMNDP